MVKQCLIHALIYLIMGLSDFSQENKLINPHPCDNQIIF